MKLRMLAAGLIPTACLLAACTTATQNQVIFPTYDPFLPFQDSSAPVSPTPEVTSLTVQPVVPRPSTPTRAPISVERVSQLLTGNVEQDLTTPTPDMVRILPTPRQSMEEYLVQEGDTLGAIARQYGITLNDLMSANNLTDPNTLEIGTPLRIPIASLGLAGPALKIIPDSELVYGPAAITFDPGEFIQGQNGYLADYVQEVDGVTRKGEEIVQLVAEYYSVNPRILLALLEYRSRWVTDRAPENTAYPMGYFDENRVGLYRQLSWAADTLNQGYTLWKTSQLSTLVLSDGTIVPIDPTINAGTAAVQYFFSKFNTREAWEKDISETGVILSYFVFFGNPFQYTIEPLVPFTLNQPILNLPFSSAEAWYFTGGPHGGWGSGSAWAALDFAPPNKDGGCATSPHWVTAMADGLIVRSKEGAVLQDLDNDGYEQTGWVLLYMHIASDGRIPAQEYVFAGERIGHPSCEGGISNATHVHIARKYNGEWIAADGVVDFNMSGWIASGTGVEYDGFLSRGSQTIEAWDNAQEVNLISR